MDLTLAGSGGSNKEEASGSSNGNQAAITEKEHMFDKVVTPSDVGKLNRLVIPKQHAEKYFPLDSSSNEKGLLLNFEDRTGKSWRFRYSYWNSSQSYVMTKGWSRFVKEKKLDAGDIVSFQRGIGDLGKDNLYIDWRRRPDAPDPATFARLQFQNQLHLQNSIRWGRFYSLPPPPPTYFHQNLNYNHHLHHQQMLSFGPTQHQQQQPYYLRSTPMQIGGLVEERGNNNYNYNYNYNYNTSVVPMVIDSVPIVHGKAAGKRLRLFGVNMDCPIQQEEEGEGEGEGEGDRDYVGSAATSNDEEDNGPLLSSQVEYSKKGKSSLSFDLDL